MLFIYLTLPFPPGGVKNAVIIRLAALLRDLGERGKLCLVRWFVILPSDGV